MVAEWSTAFFESFGDGWRQTSVMNLPNGALVRECVHVVVSGEVSHESSLCFVPGLHYVANADSLTSLGHGHWQEVRP